MRGGRDYINDLGNVSECNPYGLNRSISSCDLVKNTDLPVPKIGIIESENNTTLTLYGTTSTSRSKYTADLLEVGYFGYKLYQWTVSGATIVSGGTINDKYIEVETTSSDLSVPFSVGLTVTDTKYSASILENFSHLREISYLPITDTLITETAAGTCDFAHNIPCTATSTYELTGNGHILSYLWTAVGATIAGSATESTVSVETSSITDDTFELTCKAYNPKEEIDTTSTFIHDRTDITVDVVIDQLTEDISGTCEYGTGTTCVAQSTYSISMISGISLQYSWTVTGATIVSGQGTASIVVETDTGELITTYNVQCDVTDTFNSDTINQDFTQTRTAVFEVLDQSLIYDNTNIATEFIA